MKLHSWGGGVHVNPMADEEEGLGSLAEALPVVLTKLHGTMVKNMDPGKRDIDAPKWFQTIYPCSSLSTIEDKQETLMSRSLEEN